MDYQEGCYVTRVGRVTSEQSRTDKEQVICMGFAEELTEDLRAAAL